MARESVDLPGSDKRTIVVLCKKMLANQNVCFCCIYNNAQDVDAFCSSCWLAYSAPYLYDLYMCATLAFMWFVKTDICIAVLELILTHTSAPYLCCNLQISYCDNLHGKSLLHNSKKIKLDANAVVWSLFVVVVLLNLEGNSETVLFTNKVSNSAIPSTILASTHTHMIWANRT